MDREKLLESESLLIDQLCAILVKNKVLKLDVSRDLRKEFENDTALYFEDFLLAEDLVTKEDLLPALSELYQVPETDVVGEFFDHNLVKMFPKDVMLRNAFIPFDLDQDNDVLIVIAARPNHPELPEIIGRYVAYDVVFMVGLYRDICDSVKEFFDESIEKADLSIFESPRDDHEFHPILDIDNKMDDED